MKYIKCDRCDRMNDINDDDEQGVIEKAVVIRANFLRASGSLISQGDLCNECIGEILVFIRTKVKR